MRRGHRIQGAASFSIDINRNKLPEDHPFSYESPVEWAVDAHRVFDSILDWKHIEVGEPHEMWEEGRRYKGFEIFGLTPRGSACRLWYVEQQLAWMDRRIEGVIVSKEDQETQQDLLEVKRAFERANPAYNFTQHHFRKYP